MRKTVWALFSLTSFWLTTQYGYSLKPSVLLFRDTLIFPLRIHRCLRGIQATKSIIPYISVDRTASMWHIRSLET